jgi:hypothetical protein
VGGLKPPVSTAPAVRFDDPAREDCTNRGQALPSDFEAELVEPAQAKYAVKKVNPNWNEQAAKAAQTYLDTSSFSHSGLVQQLVFEGFTRAQAEYGVKKVGL